MSLFDFFNKDEIKELNDLFDNAIKNFDQEKYDENKASVGKILGTDKAISEYTIENGKEVGVTEWIDTRNNKQHILKTITREEIYGTGKFIDIIYTSTFNGRTFAERTHDPKNGDNLKAVHEFSKGLAFNRMLLEYNVDIKTDFEGIY